MFLGGFSCGFIGCLEVLTRYFRCFHNLFESFGSFLLVCHVVSY